MRIDQNTTLSQFIHIATVFNLSEKQVKPLMDKIAAKKINQIGSTPFPQNLNDLTFDHLCRLQTEITDFQTLIKISAEILLNTTWHKMLKHKAIEVLAFTMFVTKEIERITKLFDKIKHKPTPEEIQAGINTLTHGLFGTADWYARRMCIENHEEVFKLPWVRIYKCLEIDAQNNRFEKKLREIYNKKK